MNYPVVVGRRSSRRGRTPCHVLDSGRLIGGPTLATMQAAEHRGAVADQNQLGLSDPNTEDSSAAPIATFHGTGHEARQSTDGLQVFQKSQDRTRTADAPLRRPATNLAGPIKNLSDYQHMLAEFWRNGGERIRVRPTVRDAEPAAVVDHRPDLERVIGMNARNAAFWKVHSSAT